MDDFDFAGKTVLIRVDINSPRTEAGKIEDSARFAAHSETIKELQSKGAKVVIITHQGRKGDVDFFPLAEHFEILKKHGIGNISYVPEKVSEKTISRIKKMKNGEALLLENIRFYDEETSVKTEEESASVGFVKQLAAISDFYINDAFSVSHRFQASVMGFPQLIPSIAGRIMQKELEGLDKALEHCEHPNIYVLGGAKPDDCFKLLKFAAKSKTVDKILTSGIIGELCLVASGIDVGSAKMSEIKEKEYDAVLPELKEIISKYSLKIEMPLDVATEVSGKRKEFSVQELKGNVPATSDIGSKTISRYTEIISTAKTIYFKGPVGVYENPLFTNGTKSILKAIEQSHAFSLMGGGHSLAAAEKFGIDKNKISHISLAGGATLEYLQGKELPGVAALKKSYQKFRSA